MKAKEYAQKFNDDRTLTTFTEICNDFMRECGELINARSAKTDSAALAIFREQDDKWRAFCGLVPGIRREGFRLLTKEKFPVIFQAMGWGDLEDRDVLGRKVDD